LAFEKVFQQRNFFLQRRGKFLHQLKDRELGREGEGGKLKN